MKRQCTLKLNPCYVRCSEGSNALLTRIPVEMNHNARQAEHSNRVLPTILIIDDDVSDATLLRRLLLKAHVRNIVIAYSNAEEAMKHLRGALAQGPKPGLIFLDISMPYIDGFSFLAWIRRQRVFQEVKIVVLSGSEDPQDGPRSLELGADAYLKKMPSLETLRKLVGIYLRHA